MAKPMAKPMAVAAMQCMPLVALLLAATAAHPSKDKRETSRFSEFFYTERDAPADVDFRTSLHPNLQPFCSVQVYPYDRPTCGEAEDGHHYRLVQNDTHTQSVITYKCINFMGNCDRRDNSSIGGSCAQRYRYRLMLAYLPSVANCSDAAVAAGVASQRVEQLGAVQIKLASHCVCMVKPKPKATRAPPTSPP